MNFPPDYYERVYAGVLGKIIGVYLGRPIEGWDYDRIMSTFGEIKYYVNDHPALHPHNPPLIITDDDIIGTFAFFSALSDYGNSLDLTPAQIGQTWLNTIIENRTILWWGGMGNSTEHTAYLRLKNGIAAPCSGSMALNGKVVSEQIGAQIFIEGWGLVAPGDPALAADLARRAASVSHDGEAVFGAQIVAALVAQAFVEPNLDSMLDTATALIPRDSTVYRLIADLRSWHAADSHDWHAARAKLAAQYGYDKYSGNCHIIPNHGLVILSLLYSGGNFSLGQTIVNTCGWDTDCNAANVGSILGVRNGLVAFEGSPDWRGPLADQLYLPTADGGRAISDALLEADFILKSAHSIHGMTRTPPKAGSRFHFSLPGSEQGFRARQNLTLENVPHPADLGQRVLALRYQIDEHNPANALTPTFIPPEAIDMPGYRLLASPTLYPGQTVRAKVLADAKNGGAVQVGIHLEVYAQDDITEAVCGEHRTLAPGTAATLEWQIPALSGVPIALAGLFIKAEKASTGTIYLDWLTWDGTPEVVFGHPAGPSSMWMRQWVNAADHLWEEHGQTFRIIQNCGRGLVLTGTREWTDYHVQAALTPHMVKACGLAARVQGLERYYALLLAENNMLKLIRRLDGETILAETAFDWEFGLSYRLELTVRGCQLEARVNGKRLFSVEDASLPGGGIGLACEEGRMAVDKIAVTGVANS